MAGGRRERDCQRERDRRRDSEWMRGQTSVAGLCHCTQFIMQSSCKEWKTETEGEELGVDVIAERCLHYEPVSAQWSSTSGQT